MVVSQAFLFKLEKNMYRFITTLILLTVSHIALSRTATTSCDNCSNYQYEQKALQKSYSFPNNTGHVLVIDFHKKLMTKYVVYREGPYSIEVFKVNPTGDESTAFTALKSMIDIREIRIAEGSAFDLANNGSNQVALSNFIINEFFWTVIFPNEAFGLIANAFKTRWGYLIKIVYFDGTYTFLEYENGRLEILDGKLFDSNNNLIPTSATNAMNQIFNFPQGLDSQAGGQFVGQLNLLGFGIGSPGRKGTCTWDSPSGTITCHGN